MKYFVVTTTIKDGEYEYLQQTPIEAKNEVEAGKSADKDNQEWVADDYREAEVNRVTEITQAEYSVISKYIY